MMERKPDWEDQLHLYFVSIADAPHVYGTHDCMVYSAEAIDAETGTDLAAAHRGKYTTAAEAVRYLASLGFASPEEMIDATLPERPVGFARRGDIVLADSIPGVCWGDYALFIGTDPTRAGLFRVPRADWSKAWGVGDE